MVATINLSAVIDRASAYPPILQINADFYVSAYIDPETEEYFPNYGWSVTLDDVSIGSGGYDEYDSTLSSTSFSGELTLTSGLHELELSASNSWSGESAYLTAYINNNVHAEFEQNIFGSSLNEQQIDIAYGSAFSDNFDLGQGDDVADGGDGADTIDGGRGADRMMGGLGSDSYFVDDAGDRVIEAASEGDDTVFSSISYGLAAGQEIETLQLLASTGTGNLTLTGNEFANTLIGNAGGNVLDGKGGADTASGGLGDDVYGVDDAGDRVFEAAGGGSDVVFSTVSYALSAGEEIEALQLLAKTGTAALSLAGNEFTNLLVGNAGANVLDGKGGADVMIGNLGDDIYGVDAAGDRVLEAKGQGNDTIFSSVSYALEAYLDIETLQLLSATGTAALSLAGNEIANRLVGNAGANVLDGKGGVDIMIGGFGNDVYGVDTAADQVIEAAGKGSDTVFSKVSYALAAGQAIETLQLLGSTGAAALNLTGNEFANTLVGNSGASTLIGGGGADVLRAGFGRDFMAGGAGNDVFLFAALGESGTTLTLADRVTDLAAGDKLDVSAIDANISAPGDGAFVLDRGGAFSAGEIRQTKVGADLFLEFNTDADASAEMAILLTHHGLVGSGDFVL